MRRARRPAQPPSIESGHIPAPTGGINQLDPAIALPPGDALICTNMLGAEYGLRSRLGYREWCTGLTGTADNTVRSILPYTGSSKNGSNDKLFACTQTGIWSVGASSSSPTQPVVFPTASTDSGWGVSTVMTTAAGRFLLYWDEENGYYTYTESNTTWAKVAMGAGAGQVANVDPGTLAFGCVWKNRVWAVQKDTSLAWYLGLNAITGSATSFDFGTHFRAGGNLVGLYSWSYDGGSGMDTLLVAISSAGDVVIYQGTDPAAASTFGIKGVWYLGGVPYGRRIATNYGGDMLILSSIGIVPLSKLVIGNSILDRSQYATNKIANLFNVLATTYKTLKGWSLRVHPNDNAILVTVPVADGQPTNQLAMSLATKGWSQYSGLPMISNEAWGGQLYFGTHDGRVCVNTDYIDGVLLSNPNAFTPVSFSLLTGFQNLGNARQKRVHMIRPTFISQSVAPSYNAEAKFRYDISTAAAPLAQGSGGASAWDTALWDSAKWTGAYAASQALSGGAGCGPEVAIAITGTAVGRTVLTGIDVLYDQGGLL